MNRKSPRVAEEISKKLYEDAFKRKEK